MDGKYELTDAQTPISTSATENITVKTYKNVIHSCALRPTARKVARKLIGVLLVIAYYVYVVFAILHDPAGSIFVCCSTPLVTFAVLNYLTNQRLAKHLRGCLKRALQQGRPRPRFRRWMRRISTVLCVLGLTVFLIVDIWDDLDKWRPIGGLAVFVICSILFSRHPSKINWVPVTWGLLLQFFLGLVILRWRSGFLACHWLGQQVTTFLGYTDKGSQFVFGDYTQHPVVFKILPVVVFFSAIVSVLYYLGLMQRLIQSIAVTLQYAMNTTPIESFATAAHIFIGQVESSVALKPFLSKLTESELHALMTSGYATVAGTVIAAYVEFGVAAEHVISASFMSAPAALAIAKISIPETKVSQIKSLKDIQIPQRQESNLLESLSVGATGAIQLVAYVVVNLIAFVAVLSFLDAVVSYLGGRVGYPELNFELICSYIFMPLAALMGVPLSDTRIVGRLIGKKIIINEFLAYADLGELIKDGTLTGRSAVISTYILCGFGSIAAIGINLGCLTSAEPTRRADFARLSVRSMVNGNLACFMTACIAGLLYQTPATDVIQATLDPNATIGATTAELDWTFNSTHPTVLY